MGVAKFDIVCLVFLRGFLSIAFAFLWHDDPSGHILELDLVGLAAEALVEADAFEGARPELLQYSGDRGGGLGMLVGLSHVVIVNDKVILVGGDEEFAAKFHRAAGLALADPLGVGLKEREDLFVVRDGFAPEDAPLDEVDVFVEHLDKVGQLDEAGALNGAELKTSELAEGGVGLGAQGAGFVKVDACPLLKTFLFVGASLLADVAKRTHLVFEPGSDRVVFAPAGKSVILSQGNDDINCLAARVPEQVDVGGEVNIGFKNVGVTFGDDLFLAVFF